MHYLSQDITAISTGTTATSGTLSGRIIDLASGEGGFPEGVLAVGHLSASNSTMHLKSRVGTASDSMSDTTGDVPGTLRTLYLDHHRPTKRFLQFQITGATTTGAYKTLDVITYGHRRLPTTYDASATGLRVASPGTGTATG